MKFGVREICDVVFKAKADTVIGTSEFKKGDKVTFSSNTIHGKKYGIDKYGKRVRKRYETYFFLKESGKYYILYSNDENNYIKVIKKYVKKV